MILGRSLKPRRYNIAIAQPSLRRLRLLMRKSFCYCYCEPQAPFPGRGCGGWDRYGRLVAGNFQTKKANQFPGWLRLEVGGYLLSHMVSQYHRR